MRLALERTAEQIERSTTSLVFVILAAAAYVATRYALHWRLTLDEIMTALIVKMPTVNQIWAVAFSGADNQPIAYDLLLRESVQLFGNDALGIRGPSLCGYLLGAFCLYLFVRLVTGTRLYGLLAVLFCLTSGAWYYATEGRPYGLMFGCGALAAVFWQHWLRNQQRWLWLAAFSLTLAAGLNLHYYSVLLFFPFAVAEVVRTYLRRRVDIRFWIAWAVPVLALLPYISLIRTNRTRSGIPDAYFAKPSLFVSLRDTSDLLLSNCLLPLLGTAVLYLAFQYTARKGATTDGEPISGSEIRLAEAALVGGFALIPLPGIAISVYGTHIFFARYFIAALFGFSAVFAMAFAFACRRRKEPAVAASLVFALFLVHGLRDQLQIARWWTLSPAAEQIMQQLPKQALQSSEPIVADYVGDFMQFSYYGDAAMRRRIFYLTSESMAKRYIRFTFQERMMIGSAPFFGTNVVPFPEFTEGHRAFYMFGGVTRPDWLLPKLLADGAQLQLVQGGIANPNGDFYIPVTYAKLPQR